MEVDSLNQKEMVGEFRGNKEVSKELFSRGR